MKRGFELAVRIPIRTVSELNQAEHWTKRHRRRKKQKREVFYELASASTKKPSLPCDIWLTRIAPRKMDGDNLQSSFKAVRDAIADWMGFDDGDDRLQWRYDQRSGEPKEYAILIQIFSD